MDIAIKEKWVNPDAKCRLCPKMFCCTQHRVKHEELFHPQQLRNILTSLNNQCHQDMKVNALQKSKLSKDTTFKYPHSPDCTRKRKRENIPLPENTNQHLLQTLNKKKKTCLTNLRNPRDTPKSSLATVNNGVRYEGEVLASPPIMTTSSPFDSSNESNFINITPIENNSPEEVFNSRQVNFIEASEMLNLSSEQNNDTVSDSKNESSEVVYVSNASDNSFRGDNQSLQNDSESSSVMSFSYEDLSVPPLLDSEQTEEEVTKQGSSYHDTSTEDTFMTASLNNTRHDDDDSRNGEFRTPSEWEISCSGLGKSDHDNKTPKLSLVNKTPKRLQQIINPSRVEPSQTQPFLQKTVEEDFDVQDESETKKRRSIIGTVVIHQVSFEIANPETIMDRIPSLGNTTEERRDSGFQSLPLETMDMLGASNYHRMSLDSDTSLRDISMSQDFSLHFRHENIISNDIHNESDQFICINEELKNHPNINCDRRKFNDFLNLTLDKTRYETDIDSPLSMIKGEPEKNKTSTALTDIIKSSISDENSDSFGYVNLETKEIYLPSHCFDSEFSTIHEDGTLVESNTLITDEHEQPHHVTLLKNMLSNSRELDKSQHSLSPKMSAFASSFLESEKSDQENEMAESSAMKEEISDQENSDENTEHNIIISEKHRSSLNEESKGTLNSSEEDAKIAAVLNYTIKIDNIEESVLVKYVSSLTEKLLSLLPFKFSMSKSCTVYNLDDLDYGKIEEYIRMRDPIREFTTTLEMSRKLIRPIDGEAPYYVKKCEVSTNSSLDTIRKENIVSIPLSSEQRI